MEVDAEEEAAEGEGISLFQERRKGKGKQKAKSGRTMSKQDRAELEKREEAEAARYYAHVNEVWDAANRLEQPALTTWLEETEKLLNMFQTAPVLFVSRAVGPIKMLLFNGLLILLRSGTYNSTDALTYSSTERRRGRRRRNGTAVRAQHR